ncbi:MAG TPA: NDP-sugar synthase [Blastocatellia bacterium]|nr:NDP-sugar synthase [Blastocatellia bacterium]
MQALILAGGKGTRLRPLTIHTPKPVVPIVNKPFLNYQIDLLKRAHVKDITLSLSYQPGKIEEIFADGEDYGVRIHYAVEATPLGTGGAYKNAEKYLTETAIVFNGDVLTDMDLTKIVARHKERKAAATVVLVPVENVSAYGVVETDEDGRVQRFVEKPKPGETTANTINAGCYILEPHILNYVPPGETYSFEYQIFPAILKAGEPFYAHVWNEYWLDIGKPQSYLQANYDLINDKLPVFPIYRHNPQFGSNSDAPKVDFASVIDPSCTIKPGVEITNSVIGPNCIIEEKAKIENSVLWAASRIGKEAVIRNSIIGKSGIIGKSSVVNSAILGDKSSLTDYTII